MEKKEIEELKIEIAPLAHCFHGNESEYGHILDLNKDDGLEYLEKVANQFWPFIDFDEDGRQYTDLSYVPRDFYNELKKGNIDTSRETLYTEDKNLLSTLDAFKLDYRKFWYLCLAVKWQSVNHYAFNKDGAYRKLRIDELTAFVEKLKPLDILLEASLGKKIKLGEWHTANMTNASLELRIEDGKHPLKIDDNRTLAFIASAVEYLLDLYNKQDENSWLRRELNTYVKDNKDITDAEKLYYFYEKLKWFLDPLKAKNYTRSTSVSKDFLISRMLYILGLTDIKRFYTKDTQLKNFIKNIKKKKEKR